MSEEDKYFAPLLIMKQMEGFDELNDLMTQKFNKSFLVKGEAKLKNFKLTSENLKFEWEGDITNFRISGSAVLLKKSLFKTETVAVYEILYDRINKKIEINPDKKRDKVLALLCLLIMEAIRSFAKEVKKR